MKVGFVGIGKYSGHLAHAVATRSTIAADRSSVWVTDLAQERLQPFKQMGCNVVHSESDHLLGATTLVEQCDIVFVGIPTASSSYSQVLSLFADQHAKCGDGCVVVFMDCAACAIDPGNQVSTARMIFGLTLKYTSSPIGLLSRKSDDRHGKLHALLNSIGVVYRANNIDELIRYRCLFGSMVFRLCEQSEASARADDMQSKQELFDSYRRLVPERYADRAEDIVNSLLSGIPAYLRNEQISKSALQERVVSRGGLTERVKVLLALEKLSIADVEDALDDFSMSSIHTYLMHCVNMVAARSRRAGQACESESVLVRIFNSVTRLWPKWFSYITFVNYLERRANPCPDDIDRNYCEALNLWREDLLRGLIATPHDLLEGNGDYAHMFVLWCDKREATACHDLGLLPNCGVADDVDSWDNRGLSPNSVQWKKHVLDYLKGLAEPDGWGFRIKQALGLQQVEAGDGLALYRYCKWWLLSVADQPTSFNVFITFSHAHTIPYGIHVGCKEWPGIETLVFLRQLLAVGVLPILESMAATNAVRAAAAAIMARNKSHNFGSHITPRSRLEDLKARVEDLLLPVFREDETSPPALDRLARTWISPDDTRGLNREEIIAEIKRKRPPRAWVRDRWEREAFPILQGLRDGLDDYAQRKDEFVAEFSTDPLISTRAATFYREVILPFIENTGLTDALAANEGIRYTWDTNPGIVVRCFVRRSEGKAAEITPTFHPEEIPVRELDDAKIGTGSPPYGMRFAYRTTRGVVVDIPTDPIDPRIALPGPVGEMAFYGILENIIRNAAKHGGHRRDTSADALEVHVVLTDQDVDHYRVAIYENLSGPQEKLKDVAKLMQSHIDKDIVEASGEPRKEAWGTAEMKLCADLLCGATPGATVDEEHKLEAKVVDLADYGTTFRGEDRPADSSRQALAYTFSIRKSWTAVFLGFGVDSDIEKDLEPRGFRFGSGEGLVDNQHLDLPPAFQFAVLHGGLFDGINLDDETCDQMRRALRRLPFRIIVWGLAPKADAREFLEGLGVRCVSAKVNSFGAIDRVAKSSCGLIDGNAPGRAEYLTHWLWQTWLDGLRRGKDRKKAIITDLYFHQEKELKPTSAWQEQADAFNRSCSKRAALNLRVWEKTRGGLVKCVTKKPPKAEIDGMRVIVDRHGEFISDRAFASLSKDDCLIVIDKNSNDFDALYNATFRSPWQLPYELAEAGLLRLLVVDERIVQRAGEPYPATEKSRPEFRQALTGSKNELPRMRDVAERAGVHIPVYLKFYEGAPVNGRARGHLLKLAVREWRTLDEDMSESTDCIAVHLRQTDDSNKSGGKASTVEHVDVPEGMHLVVVHQGIVDLINDRYGETVANGFVKALSCKHWIVVESGRGIPPEVQKSGEKFLSFSLIDRAFHGKRVAKLGLIRHLMEVTRNRDG